MAERIFVGLGSNVGDRLGNLEHARVRLAQAAQVRLVASASIYETEPVGPVKQGWFLNTVVELATRLSPRALLQLCQQIEADLGRVKRERWGPREIDLDLLLYGERVIDEPDLKLPHPELARRRFVLEPLAELAPQLQHPTLHKTMQELRAVLKDGTEDDKGVMRYQEGDSDRRPLARQAGGDRRGRSVI
jgi:2-amino-4-hydroxy-6-hydroxymethyldihydropteridine diphosphokinase